MQAERRADIVVAGHICLDIIPAFERRTAFEPGHLYKIGPAVMATGGAVSNTGIALHRLGVATRLMGKVGDDLIGRAIVDFVRGIDPSLAAGMIVAAGETSSYTVVINQPGVDRTFLHCTGANDTFVADDVAYDRLEGAKLFHFGYPTLMRSIYADGGRQMETIFRRVKERGLTTSLDMSQPDPESEAGRVDWAAWLRRVLPQVDVYLPSLDETRLMLGSDAGPDELARRLRDLGAGLVGLKLGDRGLYVLWPDGGLYAPCFKVNVVGTTGSGDCTIAGFLAGLVRGLPPEKVMTLAVAAGACCCEAADATSGVLPWDEVWRRIESGWDRLPAARPIDEKVSGGDP
jgi:sugar/nucleoside kinase (ribokinase family)